MALGHQPVGGATAGERTPPRLADGGTGPELASLRESNVSGPQWDRWEDSAVVAADGTAIVTLQAGQARVLFIERLAVSSTSAAASAATVYVGSVDPKHIADRTALGNGDIADEQHAIFVPAGATVSVQWTGATPGAVCSVGGQYRRQIAP